MDYRQYIIVLFKVDWIIYCEKSLLIFHRGVKLLEWITGSILLHCLMWIGLSTVKWIEDEQIVYNCMGILIIYNNALISKVLDYPLRIIYCKILDCSLCTSGFSISGEIIRCVIYELGLDYSKGIIGFFKVFWIGLSNENYWIAYKQCSFFTRGFL